MHVGTIAYATDSGLGVLAKAFVDHGVVTDILVVRHSRHPTHDEWYPNAPQTQHRPFDVKLAQDFCASMDTVLFLETPFDWSLIPYCKSHGVKTVLCVMHECSLEHPPHQPDLILAPSHLDHQAFPGSTFIPVPVDVPWKYRGRAETFVHNAGHGGMKGRNGTKELLDALQYVRSPTSLILRSQQSIDMAGVDCGRVKVSCRFGTFDHATLWDEGDICIHPTKFDGLSLPIQEAYASGMAVITGDRFPMNKWLPNELLVPISSYTKERIGPPYREYDRANYDPVSIAMTMDRWAWEDIGDYSKGGREWAKSMSWDALRPKYLEALR